MSTAIRMATSPPTSGLDVRVDVYDTGNNLLESLTATEITGTGIYTASTQATGSGLWARIYTPDGSISTVQQLASIANAAASSPAVASSGSASSVVVSASISSSVPAATGISYRSKAGDMLDDICYRHYGREDALIDVYEANPGLAAHGLLLPSGVLIWLPDLPAAAQASPGVQLWN